MSEATTMKSLTPKKLATWILIACFFVTSNAQAAPAPRLHSVLEGLTRQSRYTRFSIRPVSAREADSKLAEAAKLKAKQTSGMIFETFLFITTLAVIDVTAREVKKQGLRTITPAYMSAITLKAASEVVDMPEIYAGLAGASATLAGTKASIAALRLVFKTPSIKKAFVPVLARAASASITFVGWELGSQLWTESSLLLSDADYKIASSFIGMSGGVAATTFAAGSPSDRERARVAGLMVQNMIRVAVLNPELRSQWMNNTWRLHVMTGDFMALLGAMIAAGEIGSHYGRIRGFFAGVVLGALTLAIPRAPKDAVTGVFQSARARVLEARLSENTETLKSSAASARFPSVLTNRRAYRESLATIVWERLHRATAAKDHADANRQLREFSNLYAIELSTLETLSRSTSVAANHRSLDAERSRVAILKEFADLLREEGGAKLVTDSEFRQITDANNARGFTEAPVIQQMQATD
jgi:hypothetical protein